MATKVGKNMISRGTTPLLRIKLPILADITPTKIWLTFSDADTKKEFFTIYKNDIQIVESIYLEVRLTQAQTLLLQSEQAIWQLRMLDSDNFAYASRPDPFLVGYILKGGEI